MLLDLRKKAHRDLIGDSRRLYALCVLFLFISATKSFALVVGLSFVLCVYSIAYREEFVKKILRFNLPYSRFLRRM